MIFIFILMQNLWANPCDIYPKNEQVKVICQLDQKNSGLQIILSSKACEFPEGQKRDCLIFRECNKAKKEGRTFILKDTNLNDYCLLKDNLFSSSKKSDSIVKSHCEGEKFIGFFINHKGSKESKLCPFQWK
jgi:hypothetical protein